MYDAVNPSIVKVHSDSGTGSGFLIREDGLIATNHHVVRNSRYLAVEFPDGRKVTTDVVLLDSKNDLAILKVNRGTAQQWIKEGKQAAHWTRLSCHRFRANGVRLQLSVLEYNLGNLWRRLVCHGASIAGR